MVPSSQVVSYEDGLTAETGLTIKILMWNEHIIYPTSQHDQFPLYQ